MCILYMYYIPSSLFNMNPSSTCDTLIDASTQTIGVNVNIRRTITPAKYTADTA